MRENKILSNLYIQFVDVNSIAKEYRYDLISSIKPGGKLVGQLAN